MTAPLPSAAPSPAAAGTAPPPPRRAAASRRRSAGAWLFLLAALALALALSLSLGSAPIPLADVLKSLAGYPTSNPVWDHILRQIRLPRALAAILGGACLALSGLEMQTLFRNPLAGPYSLGISSAATLGVALAVLAGAGPAAEGFAGLHAFWAEAGVAVSAMAGSAGMLVVVLALSRRIRDNTTLLILGLMFGQMAGALVSALQAFSDAESIRAFTFWTFGSFAAVTWGQMPLLAAACGLGAALAAFTAKPLNALLLGENYARSLGVPLAALRFLILAGTSVMAGAATAFCGPVAFIGLAVPHLCRGLFHTSDHRVLAPACLLLGAVAALTADFIAGLPGSDRALPLNAVTALLGGPVVIAILLRRRRPSAP